MKVYDNWSQYPESEWRWPSFTPKEMACKGTGRLMLDPGAMDKLQALRNRLGKPLVITSAYRSPEHNRAVGGARNSKHMLGIAFDVMQGGHDPAEFIAAARAVGFAGIGTYPRSNFIHVDARERPAKWGDPFPASTPDRAAPAHRPVQPQPAPPATTAPETKGGLLAAILALLARMFGGKK